MSVGAAATAERMLWIRGDSVDMPTPYGAGPTAGDAASGAARPLLSRGGRG